jgi:16S rRNA (cytosine1402-N4)-methyltransferase
MLAQVAEALALQAGEIACDCTLGGAGHTLALAADLTPGGMLIGIDRDPLALKVASERMASGFPDLRFVALHGNFSDLDDLLLEVCTPGVDAFLFDLGVSSPQLDLPERGFSYARSAPLDMRLDPGEPTLNAAEIINTTNEADLTWILRFYGEERWAARIAHHIVEVRQRRPLATTDELVELIREAIPAGARRTGGNPAKRSFQALRIAVNGELDALRTGLEAAIRWLNPAGRIVVISYHSLEDRIVKELFARMAQGCICPPEAPVCTCGHTPILTSVSRRPLTPASEEIEVNPRAASAKLRWAIKEAE